MVKKPLSKQRRWQKLKQAAGLCIICGLKRSPHHAQLCELHRAANVAWQAKRRAAKREADKLARSAAE